MISINFKIGRSMSNENQVSQQFINKLRAGVLGANDGIVSTASIVVGVAGATSSIEAIAISGLAAVIGGAISMALGEYVSVASQRDAEKSYMESNSIVDDEEDFSSPIAAAVASFFSFLIGSMLPLIAILFSPESSRFVITCIATVISLSITGAISAKLANASIPRSVTRLVVGGILALSITYGIGAYVATLGVIT